MTALTLIIAFAFAQPPVDAEPTAQSRIDVLLATPQVACYGVAAGRRSSPVRENYFTYSPIVYRLKRSAVFAGVRVGGENKVLVHSPNAKGAIGIVRHSFTSSRPISDCKNAAKLFAPGRAQLTGWGRPLDGQTALPEPAGPLRSTHGCYRLQGKDRAFWGTHEESGGRYRKVSEITANGTAGRAFSPRRLDRIPLAACAGNPKT